MTPETASACPTGKNPLTRKVPAFRKALRDWYVANQRQLPWRTDPSLYRTVVSEFMLQQTRIDTALPFFDRWMATLPTFSALAAAPEEQVLKLWEGLGYYRRARNLHRLARELVALPEIPDSPDGWLAFSGVGPYSAAAITSIAFNAPAACVDGNVVRVLARLTACDQPLKDTTTAARLFQPLAQKLLNPKEPGLHNQAMMELGATICQRQPNCEACPVARFCEGHRLKKAARIPVFPAKQMEKVTVIRVWAERNGNLLLTRPASDARRLAQLYELPSCEQLGLTPAEVFRTGILQLKRKRSITRFSIAESIYKLDNISPPTEEAGLVWIPREDLETITFSGPHRRWINTILENQK